MSTDFKYLYIIFLHELARESARVANSPKRKSKKTSDLGLSYKTQKRAVKIHGSLMINVVDVSVAILIDEHGYCKHESKHNHREVGIEGHESGVVEEALHEEGNADTTDCRSNDHLDMLTYKESDDNCDKSKCNAKRKISLGKCGQGRKEERAVRDVVGIKADATNVNEVVNHSRKNCTEQTNTETDSKCGNLRNKLLNKGCEPVNGCYEADRKKKNYTDNVSKTSAEQADNKAQRHYEEGEESAKQRNEAVIR